MRLVELGLADKDWLSSKWPIFHAKPETERDESAEKAIPQYRLALSRCGSSFAQARGFGIRF